MPIVVGAHPDDRLPQVDVTRPADQWEQAGATWWLARFDPFSVTEAQVRQRIKQGRQI